MKFINEDAPTNSVGNGSIAGVGADTQDNLLIGKSIATIKRHSDNKKGFDDMDKELKKKIKYMDKAAFNASMKEQMQKHLFVVEATNREKDDKDSHFNKNKDFTIDIKMSDDEKNKMKDVIQDKNKDTDNKKIEKDIKIKKSDLYVWKTSESTKTRVDGIIDKFNDTHTKPLHTRTYVDSTYTKLWVSGDLFSRRQVFNQLRSVGAELVK